MNIPNIPLEDLLNKDAKLQPSWRVWFNQIINQLQTNVSDEGYQLPQQSENNISQLNIQKGVGGLLFSAEQQLQKLNVPVPRETAPGSGSFDTSYEYSNTSTYHELTDNEMNAIPSGSRNGKIINNTTDGEGYIGLNDTFVKVT